MDEITTRWKALIAAYGAEVILALYAGTEHQIQYGCGEAFSAVWEPAGWSAPSVPKPRTQVLNRSSAPRREQNPPGSVPLRLHSIGGQQRDSHLDPRPLGDPCGQKKERRPRGADRRRHARRSSSRRVLLVPPGTGPFLTLPWMVAAGGRLDRFVGLYPWAPAEFLATLFPVYIGS